VKALDIALKDLMSSLRSASAVVFMFGVPLLVTGMFYLMFGNIAREGDFNLPQTQVVIANLDRHGPKLPTGSETIPGGIRADTASELVVEVIQSDDLAEILKVSLTPDDKTARTMVDHQSAQVAIIIPEGFSRQFAESYGHSTIEIYQDPTLTLGPEIIKSFLHQFMDGLSGVKIFVEVLLENTESIDPDRIGQIIQQYLETSPSQSEDLSDEMLVVRMPGNQPKSTNPLVRIITPIMGGMMIFYAFYTATTTAQSILREEEQHTLQRLFTTPTKQSVILSGKFLSVFLTVIVQIVVLMIAARIIFRIEWGNLIPIGLVVVGTVFIASSFGIFINSMIKSTSSGGMIFGGVLTLSGMLGMISIFAINSPSAARLGNTVSLLVPQGWAVRGLLQAINVRPLGEVGLTVLIMLVWSAVFFTVGVSRFKRRYA